MLHHDMISSRITAAIPCLGGYGGYSSPYLTYKGHATGSLFLFDP